MSAPVKWAAIEVSRVDGMGELHDEGSYRRLVFESVDGEQRVDVVVSQGEAEVLALDIQGLD